MEDSNTVQVENFVNEDKMEQLIRTPGECDFGESSATIQMFVDCGSSSSFINPQKLPPSILNEVSDFIHFGKPSNTFKLSKLRLILFSALSSKCVVCARGKVNLKIGKWVGEHDFIFTEIKEAAILGLNFWIKRKANFDFKNNEIIFSENGRDFKIDSKENSIKHNINSIDISPSNIRLGNKIKLRPNSEQFVKIQIPDYFNKNEHVLIDCPIKELDFKRGIMLANTLSKIDNENTILASAMNFSDNEIELDQDYEIETVQNADIVALENYENNESSIGTQVVFESMEINPKFSIEQRNKLLNYFQNIRIPFSGMRMFVG